MNCRYFRLVGLIGCLVFALVGRAANGSSWFPFGPDGGDAHAFAADPKDHAHLYLGTATGWIYESRDDGAKWTRLAQVGKRDDLVLDNILVDPLDPRHLIVGAWVLADLNHPDGGLYVSSDGGVSWTSQPEMRGQSIRALTLAPSDPKTMVAGTLSGVFRSTDSGKHWEQISPKGSVELHEVESLAVDPADPNTVYAGTWHLPWKTTDGGATWSPMKQGIIEDSDVFSIIVDPKQPKVVYLSACSGIYKSEDGGAKFVKVQGIPSTARRTRVLMQDPNNLDTVFAGTTEGLYRSEDAGKSWMPTTRPDVIVNDVYVDPADSKRVLLATDRGGVRASVDGGFSFDPSNSGFSARQITAFTGDAEHAATLYVGVVNDKEWGGVFVSRTGGLSWDQLSTGLDGRDVFSLGQAPDGTILAGTGHGIYRLKDAVWQRSGGESAPSRAVAPKPIAGRARTRTAVVAKQPVRTAVVQSGKSFDGTGYGFARAGDVLFAATSQGLLRSVSSGVSWAPAQGVAMDEYRFIAAARGSVVVASLTALQLSGDGGATWRALTLPGKVTQISAVSVDALGEVWVAGREGVFYTADQGASWQGLKSLYVRNALCLFYDAGRERMLVTSSEPSTMAFAVQLPTMQVTSWDTGWNLRFVRPVGDHLVAGTLFDGIVVQPRMVESGEQTTAQR